MWGGELQPTTADFTGRKVKETPEGSAVDQCWFSGSFYGQAGLQGSDWTIYTDSYYAIDYVGWDTNGINYYRNELQTPCDATVPQRMGMKCFEYDEDNDPTYLGADYWVPYQDQVLVGGNETTCSPPNTLTDNVTSARDTECMEKLYP
jgi:hypothetical protein